MFKEKRDRYERHRPEINRTQSRDETKTNQCGKRKEMQQLCQPEAPRDPELYDAWIEDPARIAPPKGETAAQVAERVLAALREIEERFANAKGPVLAVSHKATLRILGAAITSAPVSLYRKKWPQDECALNLVELRKDGDHFMRLWNDTAHLDPDPGRSTRAGK